MMEWNLFLIVAAAAFGFYIGENKRTIEGEKRFFVVCVGLALVFCASRYSWQKIADSEGAYVVDGWSQERIGVLFKAPRDTSGDDERDRYSPF